MRQRAGVISLQPVNLASASVASNPDQGIAHEYVPLRATPSREYVLGELLTVDASRVTTDPEGTFATARRWEVLPLTWPTKIRWPPCTTYTLTRLLVLFVNWTPTSLCGWAP